MDSVAELKTKFFGEIEKVENREDSPTSRCVLPPGEAKQEDVRYLNIHEDNKLDSLCAPCLTCKRPYRRVPACRVDGRLRCRMFGAKMPSLPMALLIIANWPAPETDSGIV